MVDSPPLSVCSDTVQMSDQVDGVILVISSEHWQGDAELEHVLSLEDQGVKIGAQPGERRRAALWIQELFKSILPGGRKEEELPTSILEVKRACCG